MVDDKQVSRPPRAELNVLCIDGTDTQDSISFVRLLKWAGAKRGITVRNLLSYLEPKPADKGKDPRTSTKEIAAPTKSGFDKTYPFTPDKLPMKFVSRRLGYKKLGAKRRGDFILLPHGEVPENKRETRYDDVLLGSNADDKLDAAKNNGKVMESLSLAPGVLDAAGPSPRLGFALPGPKNASADFLYLSGHGGMSGNVVGEATPHKSSLPGYLPFFSLQKLAKPEFLELAGAPHVAPLWIVVSACFSLRKIHCQFWGRYFRKQKIPVRGILGYRRTTPRAAGAVPINERFTRHLRSGKTILESWKRAHETRALEDRWTGLAFGFSKNDTLDSLATWRKTRNPPAEKEKDDLFFYDLDSFAMSGESVDDGERVEISPPEVLLEAHFWNNMLIGTPGGWEKFLITNIDFTKQTFDDHLKKHAGAELANNKSWSTCAGHKSMVDIPSDVWNHAPFFSNSEHNHELYRIGLYPPFVQAFKDGFQAGDEIDFTLIHVRRNYSKLYDFATLFDVEMVNGVSPTDASYRLVKGADNGKIDTIRILAPLENSTEPVTFAVRFRSTARYMWFWFGITVRRGGAVIYKADLDSFTIKHRADPNFYQNMLRKRDGGHPRDDVLEEHAALIRKGIVTMRGGLLTQYPVFFGCFDWHSAVHGHWALLRIDRVSKGRVKGARDVDHSLKPEGITEERGRLNRLSIFEMPYGRAWFLCLAVERELASGKQDLRPTADDVAKSLLEFLLDKTPSPSEHEYENASWVLVQLHRYYSHTKSADLAKVESIIRAEFLGTSPAIDFGEDSTYGKFFSRFGNWVYLIARTQSQAVLTQFLKKHPIADDQLAPVREFHSSHHVGMNWSRAWALRALSQTVADADDRRRFDLAFVQHVKAGLEDHKVRKGSFKDYDHWIPQFAVYAMTEGE